MTNKNDEDLVIKVSQDLFDNEELLKLSKDMEALFKQSDEEMIAENKKWAEEHPEQAVCDHGVVFDEEEYKKNPGMSAAEVQKRWPRGWGLCPKGCGYNGISYYSSFHYICGDW